MRVQTAEKPEALSSVTSGFRQIQRKRQARSDLGGPQLTPTRLGRRSRRWQAPPAITLPPAPTQRPSSAICTPELRRTESASGDTFQLYLREIGQVKLLTPQEELALAARIRRGDELAREQMIKANLRLVVKIARDFEGLGLPLMDLISEGNIGLIKGVERFDPRKGAKLSTYASWWIKQAMRRALANQGRTIRLPVHAVDKVAAIQRAETRLREMFDREPTDEEVADELGIRKAVRVRRYRDAARRLLELDAPIAAEPGAETALEITADVNAAAPFERLMKDNDTALLRDAFADLPAREITILTMRFGLDNKTPKTLEQIGERFGITRERVRQLEGLALKKLRAAMQKRDTGGKTAPVPFKTAGLFR